MAATTLKTELLNCVETACGEVILTLKRGQEEKELVIADTGLSGLVYENSCDYYQYNLGWTQDKFDKYWENGGEEKECDSYIEMTIDNYDDDLTWEEIG